MEKRECKYCQEEKPITEFRTRKVKGKIYRAWKCKACYLIQKEIWRKANPEKDKAYKNKHYSDNKKKYNELSEKWVEENHEKRKEHANNYAKRNKNKLATYREENKEKIKNDNRARVIKLNDSYIINNIKLECGLSTEEIKKYPELIEAKKDIYKLKRLIKSKE